jgi:hypothetical protein
MTIAPALFASVLLGSVCTSAQDGSTPLFACNLKAIASSERPRYNDLMKLLRGSVRERTEYSGGYAFKLDGGAIGLKEVAEWISMERLCCPFLTFELSVSGNQADWMLTLTGPRGAKAILQEEFPTH